MLGRVHQSELPAYEDARQRNMPLYYKLNLPLNRNEAAVYLAANLGFQHDQDLVAESVRYLFDNQITRGTSSTGEADIRHYQGEKLLTRAEAVTLIQRAAAAGLTFGATLDATPKLQFPQEVIMNPDAPKQFMQAIASLPSLANLELRTGEYDATVAAVEIIEPQYEGADSASFVLYTGGKGGIYVFIRHDNEITRRAAQEVLSLYIDAKEAEELLTNYLEIKKTDAAFPYEKIPFDTSSDYAITFSYSSIEIYPKP